VVGLSRRRRLAVAFNRGGHLDPAVIGAAARRGDHDDQDLKQVRPLLARRGTPITC